MLVDEFNDTVEDPDVGHDSSVHDSVEEGEEDIEDEELTQDTSVQDEEIELVDVGDEDGGDVAHGMRKMDVVVWHPLWQVVSQNVVVGSPSRQVQG